MVEPQVIKDFFANIGKQVTNQHLLLAKEALKSQRYGEDEEGNPREPTADDLIDWIWRHTKAFVNRHTENKARAAVEIPPGDLLDE